MNFLPTTAIKFVKTDKCILSGNGNELSYYKNIKVLKSKLIMNEIKVIHGISENLGEIIVYGGYYVEFCQLKESQLLIKHKDKLVHQEFVMDIMITENTTDKLKFCICLAHGTVKFYELFKTESKISLIATSITNEKALLYCCKFFTTNCSSDIFKVGGTVLNCVVFWKHSLNHHQSNSNDILVAETACVLKNGHKGAVFGIDVCMEKNLMVTTGDDRRVLLWTQCPIGCMKWEIIAEMYGHMARVWGGKLIIDNSLSNYDCCLVTWGEDCTVNLWEFKQNNEVNTSAAMLIKSKSVHRGKGIWCGDVWYDSKSSVVSIVTGGNDGALVYNQSLLNFHDDAINTGTVNSRFVIERWLTHDSPKQLALIDSSNVVVLSNKDNLMITNRHVSNNYLQKMQVKNECIIDVKDCCMYFDRKCEVLYIGSRQGIFDMYRFADPKKYSLKLWSRIPITSSVMAFHEGPNLVKSDDNNDTSNIFVVLTSGECILLSNGNEVGSIFYPERSGRFNCVIGSIADSGDSVTICAGDNKGYLFVFKLSLGPVNKSSKLIGQIRLCTNKEGGITSLCYAQCSCGCVYVGTKSGCVYRWNLSGSEFSLVVKDFKLIGWVDRLKIVHSGSRIRNEGCNLALEVIGFKSDWFRRLIMYPQENSTSAHVIGTAHLTWEFNTSGGHRCWDMIDERFSEDTKTITLSFIQSGLVKIVRSTILSTAFMEEPFVIKPYLHGLQINVCSTLSNQSLNEQNSLVLIGGSEDTTISLINTQYSELFSTNPSNLCQISHFRGHLSSIRCLTTYTNGLSTYLLSGGGRGQLLLWRMIGSSDISHGMVCEKLGQVMLSGLIENIDMDVRVMGVSGFCCAGCYGDDKHLVMVTTSSGHLIVLSVEKIVKIISVNTSITKNSYHFKLVWQQKISSSCLTSNNYVLLKTCKMEKCVIRLVMSSTDGHLYWINFIVDGNQHISHYVNKLFIHKASIHGCDLHLMTNDDLGNRLFVLLGGDDGGVRVVAMETDISNKSEHLLAHYGSTVSTKWLSCCLETKKLKAASLASDGYLLLWEFDYSNAPDYNLNLLRVLSNDVGVRDPLCMSVSNIVLPSHSSDDNSHSCVFYIVGKGAKICTFNL